ncbi:MAG: cation:proton antiporter, partial [Gammaproteobacteria bacterium]
MTETWMLAAIWLGLALIAALFSVWLRIATALSEIVVGTLAQFVLGIAVGASVLQADLPWIKFLAGSGAILLTFLAGAELDPAVLRVKWKEATAVGLMSFLAPFIGCAVVAYAVLDWNIAASWLAGVALSTTSVAVVYAVMLEFGLNATDYGKTDEQVEAHALHRFLGGFLHLLRADGAVLGADGNGHAPGLAFGVGVFAGSVQPRPGVGLDPVEGEPLALAGVLHA